MAQSALLITVRLPEGRFHGHPEWPPSPFRLFQAWVAGALLGEREDHAEKIRGAFEWLESLPPPVIGVPPSVEGHRYSIYVPNNDIDTVGGDPRFAPKIRGAEKHFRPRLFEPDAPFVYVWKFDGDSSEEAQALVELADRIYRFGRGVDSAYATAEIAAGEDAESRLVASGLALHKPSTGGATGNKLWTPGKSSFASLVKRHNAQRRRFADGYLVQPPPAFHETTIYNARATQLLFDLRTQDERGVIKADSVAHTRAAWLTEHIRDHLARLLSPSFGEELVERVVVGRGAGESDKARRVQIIPLPSIGSEYADHAIRRVLLLIPPDCPIPVDEIAWAAGAVHLGVSPEGELVDPERPQLVRAGDEGMLRHYGVREKSNGAKHVWRTVTPVILPIHPLRGRTKGSERLDQEGRAVGAVRQALRHAGIGVTPGFVYVQREPFEPRGAKVDQFDLPSRFSGRGCYHVELGFGQPIEGPLVLGDGRYLGLGVMAPARIADASGQGTGDEEGSRKPAKESG